MFAWGAAVAVVAKVARVEMAEKDCIVVGKTGKNSWVQANVVERM